VLQIVKGEGEHAMLRPELLGLCLVVLCVACAPREPKAYKVERGRTYAEDRAVVWECVQRFLQANGITVTNANPATGVIQAERTHYQDAVWADCERAWVSDQSSNSASPSRASAIGRDLTMEVTVHEGAAGTEVQPLARFTEQQLDYRNLPFTQPCRSTGVLESALLNAVGATPPASAEPKA
jgi:hypothetical protein